MEEASRNSAAEVQWTSVVPDTEVQLRFTYVCGTTKVQKQGTPEVLFTSRRCITFVHGTPPFILHLRSALLQFNFYSVFTSCD